jgi:gluconokinase
MIVLFIHWAAPSSAPNPGRAVARRFATRHEHFMPRSLLHSQFEVLEEPGPDENPIIVSIVPWPREIVAQILLALEGAQPPSKHL